MFIFLVRLWHVTETAPPRTRPLYYQATGNQAASTILSLYIIITFVGAVGGASEHLGESHGLLLEMKVPR